MCVFFVIGLKRSGNHLLINWLLSFFSRPYFHNDCHNEDRPFDSTDANSD